VLTPQQGIDLRIRIAERAHDTETAFGVATNAAAVKNAEEAIKAALLVNGGSSVAMLAFVGSDWLFYLGADLCGDIFQQLDPS
jgi:hypothetical protein